MKAEIREHTIYRPNNEIENVVNLVILDDFGQILLVLHCDDYSSAQDIKIALDNGASDFKTVEDLPFYGAPMPEDGPAYIED